MVSGVRGVQLTQTGRLSEVHEDPTTTLSTFYTRHNGQWLCEVLVRERKIGQWRICCLERAEVFFCSGCKQPLSNHYKGKCLFSVGYYRQPDIAPYTLDLDNYAFERFAQRFAW